MYDSAKDTEGDAAEGQDKKRGDAGTEEGGEAAPAPKVNAPEQVTVTDVVAGSQESPLSTASESVLSPWTGCDRKERMWRENKKKKECEQQANV